MSVQLPATTDSYRGLNFSEVLNVAEIKNKVSKIRLADSIRIARKVTEVALAVLVICGLIGIVGTNLLITSSVILGSLLFDKFVVPYLPKTLQRPIHWIKGATKELLLYLFLYSINLIRDEERNTPPQELKGNLPLVIGVHGHYSNSSIWTYCRERVTEAGHPFISFSKSKTWASISLYNQEMKILIRDYKHYIKENGAIFLAHSMGGITAAQVGLELAERDEFKNKIQVITLASPLEGTRMAYLSPGRCAHEMRPGSKYLNGLSEKIHSATSIKFHHFASTVDLVVFPHSSARCSLPEKSPNVHLVEDAGHSGILFSDKVFDRIIDILNSEGKAPKVVTSSGQFSPQELTNPALRHEPSAHIIEA